MTATPPPPTPDELLALLPTMTPEEVEAAVRSMPDEVAVAMLSEMSAHDRERPASPLALAMQVDEGYRARPHLELIDRELTAALKRVEAGESQRLIVELPPRSGKTTLCTQYFPAHVLERHPDWSVVLASHDGVLASSWGRVIRRMAENGEVAVSVAADAGAVSEWETTRGGSLVSRSVRASLTGRGARVMVIDDPFKDFVEAHSEASRKAVWDWWLTVAQTRLEPPSLVLVVMTRWHEDDLVGRLLSKEHEGDPGDWRRIRLPALATGDDDALGREPGEPLLSPLGNEDAPAALARWQGIQRDVGAYAWSALYQQSPAPSQGSIFDMARFRYWTTDRERATADGRVVYLDPTDPGITQHGGTPTGADGEEVSSGGSGRWLDSWDMAFKGTDASDYVVGQRWLRRGPYRYLIAQRRGRWSFTQTLEEVRSFAGLPSGDGAPPDPARVGRYADRVHERLVEDKANGTAVIDVLRREVSGLIPISPRDGKEARARAVTPECESGHVLLPHPADPGNTWVADLISELREFPHGANDDQVDSFTQALSRLQDAGRGGISRPDDARSRLSSAPRRRGRSRALGGALTSR